MRDPFFGMVPRPRLLLVSVAAHATVGLLVGIWSVAAHSEAPPVDWSALGVDPVAIRIIEPLYIRNLATGAPAATARGTAAGGVGRHGGGRPVLRANPARSWPGPAPPRLPDADIRLGDFGATSAAFPSPPTPAAPEPPVNPAGGPDQPAAGEEGPAFAEPPIRIEHPREAVHDVVITESARGGGIAAYLTGELVYRVYLAVGAEREWILEFCSPNSHPSASAPSGIRASGAAPLTPPYPVLTVIPGALAAGPRDLMFRGLLAADGALAQLAALDRDDPRAAALLRLLPEWRFRPALLAGRPVEVDVLLTIPSRRH